MKILDKPRFLLGKKIKIPLYHRGHLSLFNEAKLHACFLPGIKEDGNDSFPQLVLSPIGLHSWDDIWRISINLYDKVGMVNNLFQVLRHYNLNVIASESSTKQLIIPSKDKYLKTQKVHCVEVVVDATMYSSSSDGNHRDRLSGSSLLNDLYTILYVCFLDDIVLDNVTGEPVLRIKRIKNLFNERYNFYLLQNLSIRGLTKSQPSVELLTAQLPKEEEQSQKNLSNVINIELAADLYTKILESTGYIEKYKNDQEKEENKDKNNSTSKSEDVEKPKKEKRYGRYLALSDTTERYLRIFFFPKGVHVLAPVLEYKEEIGALAEITKCLRLGNFNIITSLSRLREFGAKATCEFVLEIPKSIVETSRNPVKIQENAKTALRDCLASEKLIKKYGVSLAFCYHYGYQDLEFKDLKDVNERTEKKHSDFSEDSISKKSISEKIEQKTEDYHRELEEKGYPPEVFNKYHHLNNLNNLPTGVNFSGKKLQRIPLFLSYSFAGNSALLTKVKQISANRFLILDGSKVFANRTTYKGIIQVMRYCKVFLGIWSQNGSKQLLDKSKWWPSPWLHWELGVAQTLNLNWRLLVSSKVDFEAFAKISKDTPYIIYEGDGDFEDKLTRVINVLYENQGNELA